MPPQLDPQLIRQRMDIRVSEMHVVSDRPVRSTPREIAWSEGRRKGGCSPGTAGDPASIPHDVEDRGVATGIKQELNPQVSGLFHLRRRSQNRPGAPSQGGDTGSNPVGTTSETARQEALHDHQAPRNLVRPACVPQTTSPRHAREGRWPILSSGVLPLGFRRAPRDEHGHESRARGCSRSQPRTRCLRWRG